MPAKKCLSKVHPGANVLRTPAEAMVRAALTLEELQEGTGLSTEALEEKVRRLEGEVNRLEPIAQELKG